MRRTLCLLLAMTALFSLLSACSKENAETEPSSTPAPVSAKAETTAAELVSGEHFAIERASGWESGKSQNAVQQKGSTAQMDLITLGNLEPDPLAYLQKFHDTCRDSGLGKNLSAVKAVAIRGIGGAYFQFEDTISQEGTIKGIYCLNKNKKTYLITCWAVGWEDFNQADFPALIGQIQFE